MDPYALIYTCSIAAAISFIVLFVAYRFGFFPRIVSRFTPKLKHGLLFFLVYLLLFFFFTPLFFTLIEKVSPLFMSFLARHTMLKLIIFHLSTLTVSVAFIFFFLFYQDKKVALQVLKSQERKPPTSITNDIQMSLAAYLIICPILIFVSTLFQWIIIAFFKTQPTEQVAVQMVKSLEGTTTSTLVLFFISIAFISPIIEEVAFRGMLQNGLKQKLSTPLAVMITSTIFSLLHLSMNTGLANLPLFASLFSLSCMLGYLYERQHSLIAPVALHILFNSINLVGILFFNH